MLRSEDIRRFEERLKAERDAIESRLAADKRGIQETVQDESGVGDLEDEASLLYEREAELDEIARDRKELAQVNRALERIGQGTYGSAKSRASPSRSNAWRLFLMRQPSSMSARPNQSNDSRLTESVLPSMAAGASARRQLPPAACCSSPRDIR